jgi:hypothetical protein
VGGTEQLDQRKVRTANTLEIEGHLIDIDQHLYKGRPQLMHLLLGNITIEDYDTFFA